MKVIDTENNFRIIHQPRYFQGFIAFLFGFPMFLFPVANFWDNEVRELLKGFGILISLGGLALVYAGFKITVYRDQWHFNKTEKILTHRSGHRKSTYNFSELQKIRYSEVPSVSFLGSVGGGAIEIILANGKSLDIVLCEDRQVTRKMASQIGSIVKNSA